MSGAPLFPYWVKPHEEAWSEVCAALGTTAAQDLFAAGKHAGSRESAQVAVVLLRPETPGH